MKNTELMENNNLSKIESLLFASGEPVPVEKLSKFLKLSKKETANLIDQLEDGYRQQGRGLQVIKKTGQVQLVSAKENGELVSKFLGKQVSEELSRAGAEVLAVIAYRGPISRAEIEQIRGVNCSFTLRNLAMRGLVERKENPSDNRSFLYEISFDFLRALGISSVEQLPDYQLLKKIGGEAGVEDKNQGQEDNKLKDE